MFKRNQIVALALVFTSALFVLLITPFAKQGRRGSVTVQEPVRIDTGLLTGMATATSGVRVYKGIPYAAPPTGELRWRAPQPPAKWEGVRQTDKFSDSCTQTLARSRNPWTKEFMAQNRASEDCLSLNVWTAAKLTGEKRPVWVWIHGGAFQEGSGEIAVYDGEALAKQGIVVVTLNYRLGVLGFLAHPELTKESPQHASGNYGLLDIVAALQWIQRNIAAFGGDAQRVTIAGQSAGAIAVNNLIASPLGKGLFQGAIAESGFFGSFRLERKLAEAEQAGVKFAEAKGLGSIKALRALAANDLLVSGAPGRFGPVVDGWFLPADAAAIVAQGKQNDVPLLTGMNADEGSSAPTYGKLKAEEFAQQARQRFGHQAETFLRLYPASDDAQSSLAQKMSARDQGLVALYLWAAGRAKTSKTPAFIYYFTRAIPWPEQPQYEAFHTAEVPYVFGNLNLLDRPWEAIDRQLSDLMSAYWVNFVKTGNPNGKGLPRWTAFDAKHRLTMELGKQSGMRPLADDARFDFFNRYFAGQRAQ